MFQHLVYVRCSFLYNVSFKPQNDLKGKILPHFTEEDIQTKAWLRSWSQWVEVCLLELESPRLLVSASSLSHSRKRHTGGFCYLCFFCSTNASHHEGVLGWGRPRWRSGPSSCALSPCPRVEAGEAISFPSPSRQSFAKTISFFSPAWLNVLQLDRIRASAVL